MYCPCSMKTLSSRRTAAMVAAGAAAALVGALTYTPAAGAAQTAAAGAARTGRGGPVVLSPTPVADSWVVTLRTRDPLQVGGLATDLAGRYTGVLQRTFGTALNGFSVHMSEAAARRLATDPRVGAVEQDSVVRVAGSQATGSGRWGLDRIDQRALPLNGSYTYPTSGAGVHAYIIDTGIRTTHTDFGGRATVGTDTIGDGRNGQDCNGHGTHVAGIVGGTTSGVAKAASLVAVRVLDCSGNGTLSQVIAGIDWVTRHAVRPAVANLSLELAGTSPALDQMVSNSVGTGITYSIAAGNDAGNACAFSPARVPVALTVGASTRTDELADFSNTGSCVDLVAPGEDITSDYNRGDTDTRVISGTSMAAPHVAGAAALYLAGHPGAPPDEVRSALVGTATTGALSGVPAGTANRLLYTGDGSAPSSPAPTPTSPAPPSPTTPAPTPTPTGCRMVPLPPGVPQPPCTSPVPAPPTTTRPPTTPPPTTAPPTTIPPATGTSNDTDVAIPDPGTAQSAITVTGRPGKAPAALRVSIKIVHPYRGDLAIDLIAPDGRSYRLKLPSPYDSTANFSAVTTVNASTSSLNGTWTLRVQDVFSGDAGFIDRWSLLL
jgi:subtilisin family serine protease